MNYDAMVTLEILLERSVKVIEKSLRKTKAALAHLRRERRKHPVSKGKMKILVEESKKLLDPDSPGWEAGTSRLLRELGRRRKSKK